MVLSPPAASKFTNRSVRNGGLCKNSNELSKNSPRFPQQTEFRNLDKLLRICPRCPQSVDVDTAGLSSVRIKYVLLDLLVWDRERPSAARNVRGASAFRLVFRAFSYQSGIRD